MKLEYENGIAWSKAKEILYQVLDDKLSVYRKEYSKLLNNLDFLEEAVFRSCRVKARIVEQDETEAGLRATLNFGHTIGHGLEAISRYGKHLHGEAISFGQMATAKISHAVSGLPATHVTRMKTLFTQASLPTQVKLTAAQTRDLFVAMKLDKKVRGGKIQFVLAKEIGRVVTGQNVTDKIIRQSLLD